MVSYVRNVERCKINGIMTLNEHRDWSKVRTGDCTKSVWCEACRGTGSQRLRSQGIIPRVRIIGCRKCKGLKRIFVIPGSTSDKQANQIIPGLWTWGKSHNPKVGRR